MLSVGDILTSPQWSLSLLLRHFLIICSHIVLYKVTPPPVGYITSPLLPPSPLPLPFIGLVLINKLLLSYSQMFVYVLQCPLVSALGSCLVQLSVGVGVG